MDMKAALIDAFAGMREDVALGLARDMLDKGTSAIEVLEACREAMELVGQNFEDGRAFVPELILVGEMMKAITELLKPYLAEEGVREKRGTVVIGTVDGDIHDIGKEIVVFMLDVNGFDVADLGVEDD